MFPPEDVVRLDELPRPTQTSMGDTALVMGGQPMEQSPLANIVSDAG